ncbi:MAG: response regulator [Candidatus Acidiferrum sp.]
MKKLLVVDDDRALRGLIRIELSDAYQVIDTGEPEDGLGLALEHNPDAILLDLRMPKYSGFELCERFTSFSRTQNTPIIIVSGEAGGQTKEHCKRLGASAYFEKPIDFDALRTCLGQIARKRRPIVLGEVPVRLYVPLKLKGTENLDAVFEDVVTTESVSLNGFKFGCLTELPKGFTMDVYLTSSSTERVGKAKIIQSDLKTSPFQYDCRFLERTGPWVLK